MEDHLRRHLQKNTVAFVKDMVGISDVVNHLLSVNIWTPSMAEDIQAIKTRQDKADYIHTYIPKRGPKAFDEYYLAMLKSGNYTLAGLLEEKVSESYRITSQGVQIEPTSFGGMGDPGAKTEPTSFGGMGDPGATSGEGIGSSRHAQATQDAEREVLYERPPYDVDQTDLPPVWPDVNRSPEDVKVKLCDRRDEETRKNFEGNQAYSMKKNPRGRAIIINNEKFDQRADLILGDRTGTHADAISLELVFNQLGFNGNVKTYTNLTRQEMLDTLKSEASQRTRIEDCFVCILLSHGTVGSVYGRDGKKVRITEIRTLFDGNNCPALAGKPKLFFIQACQGETKDPRVPVQETSPDSSIMEDLQNQFKELQVEDAEQTDDAGDIPTTADVLIATATTPGYVSWRNKVNGSWFVQALVFMLQKLAYKYDIHKLLTRVNHLVSVHGKGTSRPHGFKQVSENTDTLRKDFYFFPGLYEELSSESETPSNSTPTM